MENILLLDPSKKFVKPKRNDINLPIDSRILAAFTKKPELQNSRNEYVYSKNILPMPVEFSPILVYMDKKNWQNRFIDSISVLSLFRLIMEVYIINPIPLDFTTENKERIESAYHEFIDKMTELDYKQKDIVNKIYETFRDCKKEYNEKQALTDFIRSMQEYTFNVLNLYEMLFHKSFDLKYPVEWFLTPHVVYTRNELPNPQKFPVFYCQCYAKKQELWNGNMQKNDKDHKDKIFFNLEEMKTRLDKLPADQIFNGYVDRETAFEYLQFLYTQN